MKTIRQIKSEAKHLYRLCLVDGCLDEDRVRKVVRRVVEFRQRGWVALLQHFRRWVELDFSRRVAKVESATLLPNDFESNVRSDLERVYGPNLSISFARNQSLIGGMRIKVGSDVYDTSVKARLAALDRRL